MQGSKQQNTKQMALDAVQYMKVVQQDRRQEAP